MPVTRSMEAGVAERVSEAVRKHRRRTWSAAEKRQMIAVSRARRVGG